MAPKLDLWPPHTCEKAHASFLSGRGGEKGRTRKVEIDTDPESRR